MTDEINKSTDITIKRTMEDAQLVSFLMYKGFKVTPFKEPSARSFVVFEVTGSDKDITDSISEFYNGYMVNVSDYVKCLKAVKSQMYAMKA